MHIIDNYTIKQEHTEFVLQQLNNHVLILPTLTSEGGPPVDTGEVIKAPEAKTNDASQASGLLWREGRVFPPGAPLQCWATIKSNLRSNSH